MREKKLTRNTLLGFVCLVMSALLGWSGLALVVKENGFDSMFSKSGAISASATVLGAVLYFLRLYFL